jgi:hypothetical protein
LVISVFEFKDNNYQNKKAHMQKKLLRF